MNLVVDIGNTRTKLSLFHMGSLMLTVAAESFGPADVERLCLEYPEMDMAILSSTRDYPEELKDMMTRRFRFFTELNDKTPIPLKNLYKTPGTLGKDRLAAAVGGNFLFPEENLLIIDAGSAITFDVVTSLGEFIGGNISPGLDMRFRALHHFTGRLPLAGPQATWSYFGDHTAGAIIAGVQNGILFEVEAYIEHFKKNYKKNRVIFTGGDAKFFDSKVKNSFFVDLNLVSTGLNRILEYNAENL
ncbi:MAG: type III pantothenate kinase [Bacteroidota bacterium]